MRKILRLKNSKKCENAPDSARKRRNRVRFGCWRGGSGWERMKTGGKAQCLNHITVQHMKKGNRRKPSVFAGFLAGAEGLGLGCRRGRFAAERHWRSLAPRHAVLEWMWESAAGSGEGLGVTRFPPQAPERPVLVWCCELFLEKDCVSTTTSSFERKAPPPGGWPS